MPAEILKRFRIPVILLVSVLFAGTFGYWLIGGFEHSLLDCFYMTVITVLTIGYEEVISTKNSAALRVFTIFISFTGIGTATYFLSNITAIIVEGQLKDTYRRRRTKKRILKMENHYIICGAGRVGSVIINELFLTGRDFVVIDRNKAVLDELREKYPSLLSIEGDSSLEEVLIEASIKSATGVFASTGDDNSNLVISLTAKEIKPSVRVVARCLEAANQRKMNKAGADEVVTENFIAGMRMAADMVRPSVVSFLDKMFADKHRNLRVEEILVDKQHEGKKIIELELDNFPNTLLLAVVAGDDWIYKPSGEHVVTSDSKIIVITNPEERLKLKTHLLGE